MRTGGFSERDLRGKINSNIEPRNNIFVGLVQYLFSFELSFALFLFAWAYKADPRFSFSIDPTQLFFMISVFSGTLVFIAEKKRIGKKAGLIVLSGIAFVMLALLSLVWTEGDLYAQKKAFVSLLFKSFLNFACLFFDGIIAATPGISKGFPTDKTIVLRNVPYVSFIENIEPSPLIKTGFSVIYAGGLSEIRGIRQLIEAAGLLDDSLELWLMGGWEDPVYEKQCAQLAGWKRVRYFGEKTLEDTYSIMKRADIGIVNFLPVPNSVQSLPNKVFEYLACKLPVVMSNFDYWKELFGECAVFADPFDPVSIAKKIRTLLDDRELRMKLVRAGAVLIENEYSWESESKSLIDLYKRLTGGNSSETDNGAGEQAAVY